MVEETNKTTPCKEIVVPDVPVDEKPETAVKEKELPPQPDPESEKLAAAEEVVTEGEKEEASDDEKVAESASFKEESNKVDDLIDPEKKALDEFKILIQEALNKHEFTAPPPAAAKEEVLEFMNPDPNPKSNTMNRDSSL